MNDLIFKIKADFLKALASPARLQIIELLKNKELPVGAVARKLGMEQSGLSKNLAILKQAGILISRQQKAAIYYTVADTQIFNVLRPIAEILRRKLNESRKVLSQLGRK